MRKRVFSDTVARGQLESILHPLIRYEVGLQLESLKATYAVVVIPLLIEKGGYEDVLNRVLVVDCSREVQIKRTMARSGLSRVEVEAILSAQTDRDSRLRKADDVIRNDGYPDDLANQIRTLNEKYSSIAHKKP
jgi:dephospho-CoA kinase